MIPEPVGPPVPWEGVLTFILLEAKAAEHDTPFTEFFSALQAKQERLGPEFERVLFDNLWELYAR